MVSEEAPWTIHALGDAVKAALASIDYEGPDNGQIRAVPNRRTIRYYTTLGLLDRPAAFEGRTAFYGPHHLRQLVAIKRLQAEGLPLVEVQQRLAGLPEAELKTIANVDAVLKTLQQEDETLSNRARAAESAPSTRADGGAEATALKDVPRKDRDFWAAPAAALTLDAPAEDEFVESDLDPSPSADVGPGTQLYGTSVCDNLILLIKGSRPLTDDDEEALRNAAGPLLAVLQERGLLPAQKKGNA